VEYNESPRQAAIRETEEETGLKVEISRLIGVYAGYDDPRVHVVLVVYKAELLGGTLKPGDDASEVQYFPVLALPENIAFKSHRKALDEALVME
jgi:8-oxo-dGTP diphosphatase